MEKTIWEFELDTTDNQTIEMPVDAEILCIETVKETPCIYALVDKGNGVEKRMFEIFGTGNPVNYGMATSREYLGTYKLRGDALVFHVFEYTGV